MICCLGITQGRIWCSQMESRPEGVETESRPEGVETEEQKEAL